jgi:formylglycine-generating enzyme required for sulfatase activity
MGNPGLAGLMTSAVQTELSIVVSFTIWHTGEPIVKLNGKSQFMLVFLSIGFVSAAVEMSDPVGINGNDAADVVDVAVVCENSPDPNEFALIPGGSFKMGNSFWEGSWNTLPVHVVRVDSFYMGRYEITNQQYCDYLNSALAQGLITVTDGKVYQAGSGTSYTYCATSTSRSDSHIDCSAGSFSVRTKGGRSMANDPMVRVSWYGAIAYSNWRSQHEGYGQCYSLSTWTCDFSKKGCRLPTEAEWEYAARGGLSGKRFPWGDTISHSQANYYSSWQGGHPEYSYDVNPTEGYHPTWNNGIPPGTSPVGSFPANGYGLCDMAGNVCDWCYDWIGNYSSIPQTNPTGPTRGTDRVLRGGYWSNPPYYCRVAHRHFSRPDYRNSDIGFRVVLDLN